MRPSLRDLLFFARDIWRALCGRGAIYAVTWDKKDDDIVEFSQFPGRGKHYVVQSMLHDRTINPHKIASLRITYTDDAMPDSQHAHVSRILN
jgi:hypothetical protein